MDDKNKGLAVVIFGSVGVLLVLVGIVFSIRLSIQAIDTADDIVAPFTTGLDKIDDQLTTVERLVAEFSGVLPAEAVVDIAQTLSELNTRLESVGGYLELARAATKALNAIPLIPVDLSGLSAELDGLEEGLNTLSSGLDQVTRFVLNNQDVPAQVEAGINEGLSQLRTGLEAAQNEVAQVDDAVQWWLNVGMAFTFILLFWGLVGQIGLIVYGLRLQRKASDQVPAQST